MMVRLEELDVRASQRARAAGYSASAAATQPALAALATSKPDLEVTYGQIRHPSSEKRLP